MAIYDVDEHKIVRDFTPVADWMLDSLIPNLRPSEIKVLLHIIRRTGGHGCVSVPISIREFQQTCKIAGPQNVLAAIRSLCKRRIIRRETQYEESESGRVWLPTLYQVTALVDDGPLSNLCVN